MKTPPPLFGFKPARMPLRAAAYYLGVSETKLLDGVRDKRYPQPVKDGGNTLWLLADLDAWLDARHNPSRRGLPDIEEAIRNG